MSRFYLVLGVLYFSIFNIFSLDLGLTGGVANLTYAEVSEDNKDDLYEIKSVLYGIDFVKSISPSIDITGAIMAQVPYSLRFTDALGTDDYNYLMNLIFFGGNFRTGVLFPYRVHPRFVISPGFFLNYDLLYFKDAVIGENDSYIFSIFGTGLELNIKYRMTERFWLVARENAALNFLPLGNRPGKLKWSYNLMFTAGISYRL